VGVKIFPVYPLPYPLPPGEGNQKRCYVLVKNGDPKMGFTLRSFIALLEQRGELVRIKKEVNPRFELPAILWKFQSQRKAVLFEKVKDSEHPVVGGVLQGMDQIGLSLGITPTRDFLHLEDTAFFDSALSHPLTPELVDTGPVKEVVTKGKDINLARLPVPTFFEHDSGPFITGGVGITRNPETGALNAGIYRILILGEDTLTVNAANISDLSVIYKTAEQRGAEIPIAVIIGVETSIMLTAAAKVPVTISELDVAGAIEGKSLKVVKCETSDLLVPAHAEIVIEGKVDFSKKVANNLGEAAGYYGSSINPVTKVTAITHRKDAIFYTILAGPSVEHLTLAAFSFNNRKKTIINEFKKKFPDIKNANLLGIGTSLHLIIAIDKKDAEQPEKLIKELYHASIGSTSVSQLIRRIVVVDEDVDIYDQNDVEWAIWSRVGAASKILNVTNVKNVGMDSAAKADNAVRMGIDATKDLDKTEKLRRTIIPGFADIQIDDYLD
jgi:2,5-furandicarboxylate decarboxylase 1